jgi:hypothetical protein
MLQALAARRPSRSELDIDCWRDALDVACVGWNEYHIANCN